MNKTFLTTVLAGLLLASTGCGSYEPSQAEPDNDEAISQDQGDLRGEPEDEQTNPSCNRYETCLNNIAYARCKQSRLPPGDLTRYYDKLAIINSHYPFRGCVAVVDNKTPYGRLAYVEEYVRWTRTVYVSEGGGPAAWCWRHNGTERQLNIVGYWCPRWG